MLLPPRLMVRYCAAIMVLRDDSSLTSPAKAGNSGMTTMTWDEGDQANQGQVSGAYLELFSRLCGLKDPLHQSRSDLVLHFTVRVGGRNTMVENKVRFTTTRGYLNFVSSAYKNWFSCAIQSHQNLGIHATQDKRTHQYK
jgi:hypothetical protein